MSRRVSDILAERRQQAVRRRDQRVAELEAQEPDFRAMQAERKALGQRLLMAGLGRSAEDPEALRAEIQALEDRLAAWKADRGLTEDFFTPDYTCPDCQDQGFVDGHSCHCRDQLLIEAHYDLSSIQTLLQRENFQTSRLSRFRKDRQPGEEESPYDHMEALYDDMEHEYVGGFTTHSPNLYFYGPVGTGKTFLLSAIAKGVLDKGYTVLYQTAPDLVDFLVQYAFMYPSDRKGAEDRRNYIFSCDLLVIDDLGSERTNDQVISALFEVINGRLIAGRPTIISSNLELGELAEVYDQRIASRIQGDYLAFAFYGGDLRKSR